MPSTIRHDWSIDEVNALFELPFNDLIFKAQQTHREHFDANEVQVSTLLSIKTGGCQEDCGYCSQSAHHDTAVKAEKLMDVDSVLNAAQKAKDAGATRFCMGAAWRNPKERDMSKLTQMVEGVKALGMESCMTLGMLTQEQAVELKEAGLDYYNHNIDTSEEFYSNVITTRSFEDRLNTLEAVRNAGMKTCCGGILGLGEAKADRASMLHTLATLPEHPQSVPINMLVRVAGTPLHGKETVDAFDMLRTIAVARILMPKSMVRLSAGRESMNEQTQSLCFLAGANSIFYGEKLLTTGNPDTERDNALFAKLGIRHMPLECTPQTQAEPDASIAA